MKEFKVQEFGEPEVLVYLETKTPAINDRQIQQQNYATSVNPLDIIQRAGNFPSPHGESQLLVLEVAGVPGKWVKM